MKRIVFVWELGNPEFHMPQKYAAKALLDRGCSVVFVLKGLHRWSDLKLDSRIQILQAPIWPLRHNASEAVCIPEILLTSGYSDPDQLEGLVRAWQGIYELLLPDVVVFDFAPTALLAAQNSHFKKIVLGAGFAELVPGYLSQDLKPFMVKPADRIDISEHQVLSTVNAVNEVFDLPLLTYLSELYEVDKTLIASIQELDVHGRNRTQVEYLGAGYPRLDSGGGANVGDIWNASESSHRVIVYLKKPSKHFAKILEVLDGAAADVLVFSPQFRSLDESAFSNNIQQVDRSFDIVSALSTSDLLICEGGQALTRAFLSGIPTLLLPSSLMEVSLVGLAEDTGASRTLRIADDMKTITRKINDMLDLTQYFQQAQKISEKYKGLIDGPVDARLVSLCEEFVGTN